MISVRFVPADLLKVRLAIFGVSNQIKVEGVNWPRRCATLFTYDVMSNLVNQKFSPLYSPLSDSYQDTKSYFGKPAGFWRYSDSLLGNIKPYKVSQYTWAGGVTKGAVNDDGDDITTYGLMLEYGGTNSAGKTIPARPLFTPTLGEFRGTKGMREVGRSKQNIKKRWR